MSWLLLALLGYFLLAVVFILDKIILTKALGRPVVYTFYSTIFMFGALLAWPLGVEFLYGIDWLWAIVSGLGFGFGLWTMFIAVKGGEASHINPFIGAMISVCTFALASVFLGESLSPWQVVGMAVLLAGIFLLSFFNEQGKVSSDSGFLWGALSGVLFAISHTSAKYLYDMYPFLTGFVWTRAATGVVGLLILLSPAIWKHFCPGQKARKPENQKIKRHPFLLVLTDKVLGIVGVILIQLAISLGSVTLVNALVGIQYALMFGLIYLLTRFAPAFFKEHFTRKEFRIEAAAIVLIILGSALAVF